MTITEKRKQMMLCLLTVLVTASMMISVAYADDTISGQIKSGMSNVYDIIKAIALPVGAVAAAVNALKMISSMEDERAAMQARKAIISICLGVALVYLAPYIVETVSGWFANQSSGVFQ